MGPDSPPVRIGGVTVTCAQAVAALTALERSGGIMVAQVLRAAGSPLADCDYHGAGAPYKTRPPQMAAGRGAAGYPAAKRAFMTAIAVALRSARDDVPAWHLYPDLVRAREAFAADAGYAAAMAAAAVSVRRREHAASLRAALAASARAALSACSARDGEFSCAAASACGTGGCRFAAGVFRAISAPASPGRTPRPGNHVQAGAGHGTAAAMSELEALVPYVVAVRMYGTDSAAAAEAA